MYGRWQKRGQEKRGWEVYREVGKEGTGEKGAGRCMGGGKRGDRRKGGGMVYRRWEKRGQEKRGQDGVWEVGKEGTGEKGVGGV